MSRKAGVAVVLVAAACVLAGATTASAVLVRNITDGTTLFSDDFENGVMDNAPGVNDPDVGTWTVYPGNTPDADTFVQVRDAVPYPAYQGNQFCHYSSGEIAQIYRPRLTGNLVTGEQDNGDVIQLDYMLKLSTNGGGILLNEACKLFLNNGTFNDSRLVEGSYTSAVFIGYFLLAPTGGWDHVSIRHTNGTTDVWLSVNDSEYSPLNLNPGKEFTVTTFTFWGGVVDAVFSIDAVSGPPGPGDANGDGKVDDQDASILAANWLKTGGATWAEGDFNSDGKVNDLDASILAANWPSGTSGAAVPEPSILLLLLGAAPAAWALRRKAYASWSFQQERCTMSRATRVGTVLMAAVVCVLAGAPIADAALVRNMTDGTVLFYDDFENGVVNSSPGVNDPNVGTWTVYPGNTPDADTFVQVCGTVPYPAYQGDQFCHYSTGEVAQLYRPRLTGNLVTGDQDNGDLIQLDYRFKLSTNGGGILLNEACKLFLNNGSVVDSRLVEGSYLSTTFVGYFGLGPTGGWDHVSIRHTNGGTDVSLSVNGSAYSTLNLSTGFNITQFTWWGGVSNAVFSMDAIPEPSTPAMLAALMCGLGVLLRRRR